MENKQHVSLLKFNFKTKINLWNEELEFCRPATGTNKMLNLKNKCVETQSNGAILSSQRMLVQGLGILTRRAINIKLTCCMFITMFLHCLLSHFKASFHLFTAQHSKKWNLYIVNPFGEHLFHQNTFRTPLIDFGICAIFLCKRKDVKGVEEPQPTGSTSRYEPY